MNAESVAPPSALARPAIGARAARHLDLAFRQLAHGPRGVQNERFMRIITGELHPMGNVAIVRSATVDTVEAAMRPLIEANSPASVIFVDGIEEAVARHVVAAGFQAQSMPAMAVDIEKMAATPLPAGYAFERVSAIEDRGWTEALAQGYQIPRGLAEAFSPQALQADLQPDAAMQFFAVIRNGRAVSTSLLYLADGLAGIYSVATLPEERGKGLGAHVTAESLRLARRMGYRLGVLQ